jgi:hypothetical protein
LFPAVHPEKKIEKIAVNISYKEKWFADLNTAPR